MIDTLHLYLTSDRLHARRETGWLSPFSRIEAAGEGEWSTANPKTLTLEWLTRPPRRHSKLNIYLGSALTRFMVMQLPEGLRNIEEQRMAAQAQLQHELGIASSEWVITLDAAPKSSKLFVCAVARGIVERLQELSKEYRLRLMSMRPYAVGIWNAYQAKRENAVLPQTALMAIEQDAFTLFVAHEGSPHVMSTFSHGGEPDLIAQQVRRVGLAFGAELQQQLRIAMASNVRSKLPVDPDLMLSASVYLKKPMYPDFRDLSFLTTNGA